MKTIEEKAKAYDEAIEKLKEIITMDNNPVTPKELGKHLFPELAESEDEKIRKVLVGWVNIEPLSSFEGGFTKEDILAWLEKQGEQTSWKPSKEEMDVLYGLAYITNQYDEHKEEVITHLYQDLKREFFNGSSYENMFPNTEDDVRRRSTIQVLEYARSLDTYNQYGKADIDKNIAWLEKQGEQKSIEPTGLRTWKYIVDAVLTEENGIGNYLDRPETEKLAKKLQERFGTIKQKSVECNTIDRDKELSLSLQIQAYLNTVSDELYAKGKPLYSEKRIEDIHNCMKMWVKLHNAYFYCNLEHKPVEWSDEDKNKLEKLIGWLQGDYGVLQGGTQIFANWLKSLKDKVLLQPKQEWSEEDEDKIMLIEDSFSDYLDYIREDNSLTKHQKNTTKDNVVGYVNWLKSLHPQKHWKPSEEQIKMLENVVERDEEEYGFNETMYDLLNQLKALV